VHKLKPLSETPLKPDFWPSSAVHFTCTTPLILIGIDSPWLTHSLEQIPLLIESSHWIKSSFHFYPIFPWWVTVFIFYSFSFWFIIWFVMLFYDGTFWKIPMTHWWAITYRSQTCCLVDQDSPMYIRRLSCSEERTIRFRIHSQLSFFPQDHKLTVLIANIRIVINSLQGLNHSDYVIRVCSYYVISLRSV